MIYVPMGSKPYLFLLFHVLLKLICFASAYTVDDLQLFCNTGQATEVWSATTNSCIIFKADTPRTWEGARIDCENNYPDESVYGRLVHIRDEAVKEILLDFKENQNRKNFFIGGYAEGAVNDLVSGTDIYPRSSVRDFRWVELSSYFCTTPFNASLIDPDLICPTKTCTSLKYMFMDDYGDTLGFYATDSTTQTKSYVCEYIMSYDAETISCDEPEILSVEELKSSCNGWERIGTPYPTTIKWSEESRTCLYRLSHSVFGFDTSYTQCQEIAPKGTKGRLIHVNHDEISNLKAFFNDTVGKTFVGAKKKSISDPAQTATLNDYKWIEKDANTGEEQCSTYFNVSFIKQFMDTTFLNSGTEDCMVFNGNNPTYLYEDSSCSAGPLETICEIYFPTYATKEENCKMDSAEKLKSYCVNYGSDSSMTYFDQRKSCFRIIETSTKKSYEEAQKSCLASSPDTEVLGRLAFIDTIEAFNAMKTFLNSFPTVTEVWVGAKRIYSNSGSQGWQWVNPVTETEINLNTYIDSHGDFDSGSGDCLYYEKTSELFKAAHCSETKSRLCEVTADLCKPPNVLDLIAGNDSVRTEKVKLRVQDSVCPGYMDIECSRTVEGDLNWRGACDAKEKASKEYFEVKPNKKSVINDYSFDYEQFVVQQLSVCVLECKKSSSCWLFNLTPINNTSLFECVLYPMMASEFVNSPGSFTGYNNDWEWG